MRKSYEYTEAYPHDSEPLPGSHKRPYEWAGWRVRIMLHALFTISMLCLLRFGEALALMWEDIAFEYHEGVIRIKINLLVRKTHQNGGVFLLYFNRHLYDTKGIKYRRGTLLSVYKPGAALDVRRDCFEQVV